MKRAADHHLVMAAIHPKPKPVKQTKEKRIPVEKQRRNLEKQIEAIVKMIIAWRDGQVCVLSSVDGGRCGNGLMWCHIIPQKQSRWLRLDLGNVVYGCGTHNMLDFHGDKTLYLWYVKTFGANVAEAMQAEKMKQTGRKYQLHELEAMLAHYDDLYQNRYTADLTLAGLIAGGYYGEIVRAVF